MLSKIAVASVFAAGVLSQYAPPAVVETTVAVDVAAEPAVYYYADYDNLVTAGKSAIYYQSAITPEAVARETERNHKVAADPAQWSAPQQVAVQDVYELKGATFCGEQGVADAQGEYGADGGKYKQLFVADSGDGSEDSSKVIGWQVAEDPKDPQKLVLSGKWTVYGQADSVITDVECGPNNGLFIADQGKDLGGVYWVTKDNLVAKKEYPAYQEVIPADCAAAVANVRSLSWDQDSGKLTWSNNVAEEATVPIENAGVFQYGAPAGQSPAPAECEKADCEAWSKDCNKKIAKVADAEMGEQVWAVAQGWGKVQVSKGQDQLYDASNDKVVAEVPEQVTYAEAPQDENRNVVFVADQEEEAVYAVAQQGDVKKVNDVADPYGVAYNNAYGWTNGLDEASASMVTLTAGALLAAVAMLL